MKWHCWKRKSAILVIYCRYITFLLANFSALKILPVLALCVDCFHSHQIHQMKLVVAAAFVVIECYYCYWIGWIFWEERPRIAGAGRRWVRCECHADRAEAKIDACLAVQQECEAGGVRGSVLAQLYVRVPPIAASSRLTASSWCYCFVEAARGLTYATKGASRSKKKCILSYSSSLRPQVNLHSG